MYNLDSFSMGEMTHCGGELRRLGRSTTSMEESANKITSFLYENLRVGETGDRALSLVRLFKTHAYSDLDVDLRKFAVGVDSNVDTTPGTKCLVLLGTTGDAPEWNNRTASGGHQAIPLPSVEIVHKFPMISNLVKQFGLEITTVIDPDPSCLQDLNETTFNVFLVEQARGSAYIPAQDDFVIPYRIESVIGFGGVLPSGDLFATIMFSKIRIRKETARLFRSLALCVKMAILPHDNSTIFDDRAAAA